MIIRIVLFVFSFLLLLSCNDKESDLKETENAGINKITDFIFVGMINKKPGLYRYDFNENSYKQFWSDKKEKVVELLYSESRANVLFITAGNFGRSGAFPFIKNTKVYLINTETDQTEMLEELGSGLQVFAQWEGESGFRIIINSFDKTVANFVNQRVILFNIYGKKLEDKTEIFDITKQGYPQMPENKINYTSLLNEYSIETEENNDSVSVYLSQEKGEKFIIKSDQQIRRIEWLKNILFLSLINIKPDNETPYQEYPETSKLIIYSLTDGKILRLWEGTGIKSFFIIDDKIVFDDGFEDNSHIIIYDFNKHKIIDEIKINGGCGIKNIPQPPDHGA